MAQRDLVKSVQQGVVVIEMPGVGRGTGFIVDQKGTLVTNYHVIEGARSAHVILPDKTRLEVAGFLAYSMGRDLAVLRLSTGNNTLHSLKVARRTPAKGAKVFAFGAPQGLPDSFTTGTVTAIRRGSEIRKAMVKLSGRDIYGQVLGLAEDAVWIQTSAPISHINSGGPLVDEAGEVVGINAWSRSARGNLNFAVSAHYIANFLSKEIGEVKPLARLPAPRPKLAPPRPPGTRTPSDRTKIAARLEILKNINQQRRTFLGQRKTVQSELSGLKRKLKEARAVSEKMAAAVKAAEQMMAQLNQQVASLRQQNVHSRDLSKSVRLKERADRLQQQSLNYERRQQQLIAKANQAKADCETLQPQMEEATAKMADLDRQANKVRRKWLRAADPLGKFGISDHEVAIEVLSEWINQDKRFQLAYLARGLACLQVKRYKQAVADFIKARRLDRGELAVVHAARGYIYALTGDRRRGMTEFGKAIEEDKSFYLTYIYRSRVLASSGEHPKAVADLGEATRLAPDDPMAFRESAWLLATCPKSDCRNGEKAVQHAEKACELAGGQDWSFLIVLAAAHAEAGDLTAATEKAKAAAELAPADMKPTCAQYVRLFAAGKPLRADQ